MKQTSPVKQQDFTAFVKNIAMQIAAANPLSVAGSESPLTCWGKKERFTSHRPKESGKADMVIEKIVEGKMAKFYSKACLLEQPYVKNPDITVQDLLNELMAKTGENIVIRRFTRYQLGE